jgi:hypothetical protein
VGLGKINDGTGMVTFPVAYRAIVFRPFKGEVVDAVVTQVNKMGFMAEVGPLQVFVSKHVRGLLLLSFSSFFFTIISAQGERVLTSRAPVDPNGHDVRPNRTLLRVRGRVRQDLEGRRGNLARLITHTHTHTHTHTVASDPLSHLVLSSLGSLEDRGYSSRCIGNCTPLPPAIFTFSIFFFSVSCQPFIHLTHLWFRGNRDSSLLGRSRRTTWVSSAELHVLLVVSPFAV